MTHQVTTGCFDSFFKFFRNALAIGCAVVDHRNGFALEVFHGITTQCAAQMHVIRYHAKRCFKALAGVFGVGGRGGNLRDTRVIVNFGSRNRGAGIQVAHDTADLCID